MSNGKRLWIKEKISYIKKLIRVIINTLKIENRLHQSFLRHQNICFSNILFIICITFGVIFLLTVGMTYHKKTSDFSLKRQYNEWYTIKNKKVAKVKNASRIQMSGNEYCIYNVLPYYLNNRAILFRTAHQPVEVLVDGKTIYQVDEDIDLCHYMNLGKVYHIVNLNDRMDGNVITIKYQTKNNSIDIFDFYLGSPNYLIHCVVSKNLSAIIIGVLLFVLGFLFTFGSILFSYKISTGRALHMGILAMLFSTWSLLQTGVLQLCFNNSNFFMILEYVIYLMLPISMVMNLSEILQLYEDKGLKILSIAYSGILFIGLMMQFFKMENIKLLTIITNAMIVGGILYNFFLLYIKLDNHYFSDKKLNIRVIWTILMSTIILDLCFNYRLVRSDTTLFSRIGILLFIMYMLFNYVQDYINKSNEYSKTKKMAKLAYKDVMTGLYNRTAYTEDIAEFEKQICNNLNLDLIFVIFDLNNLKEMNDFHGHGVGDYYIITTGQIIKKAFEKIGKCYRIGGDEFAVMIEGRCIEDYNAAICELSKIITKENESTDLDFSLAFGYAMYENGKYNSIKELIDEADKMMYTNKNIYKVNKFCEQS